MDPKNVVREFYELAWNQGQLDEAASLLAPHLVDHDPLPFPGAPTGAAGLLATVSMIRAGVPDLHRTVELQIAEGDLVGTRFVDEGSHRGELFGIPATGRSIRVAGINVERVHGGQIVEIWHLEDIAGLMAQLAPLADAAPTAG